MAGRLPVRAFSDRSRVDSHCRDAKPSGREPERELWLRSSADRVQLVVLPEAEEQFLPRLPIEAGIEPVKELLRRSNVCRHDPPTAISVPPGNGPVNVFDARSKKVKLEFPNTPLGKEPESVLFAAEKLLVTIPPDTAVVQGSVPVNKLLDPLKIEIAPDLDMLHTNDGSNPASWLLLTSNSTKFFELAKRAGRLPVKLFWARDTSASVVTYPTCAGIEPERWLLCTYNLVNMEMLPYAAGIVPVAPT